MICPHKCDLDHTSVDLDLGREALAQTSPRIVTRPCVIECAHWRVSSSKKGQHLLFCVNVHGSIADKAAQMFGLRIFNNDDPMRLYYDLWRYLQTKEMRYINGALFDYKNGKKAGTWRNLAWGK